MTLLNGAVRAVAAEHRISRIDLRAARGGAGHRARAGRRTSPRRAARQSGRRGFRARLRHGPAAAPRRRAGTALRAFGGGGVRPRRRPPERRDPSLRPVGGARKDGPEPVHQMRVAVRRLRSAIKVFGRAVRSPVGGCGGRRSEGACRQLAPTRDWDVFVTETAAAVAAALPSEQRLQRLLAAAERRRRVCHDELRAFLGSTEFRRLGIELACLAGGQDWQATLGDAEQKELAARWRTSRPRAGQAAQEADADRRRPRPLEPAALHAIRIAPSGCAMRRRSSRRSIPGRRRIDSSAG